MSGRHKHNSLPFWLVGDEQKRNARTPFVMVDASLLENTRFQALTAGAQVEYLCMCLAAKGKREFEFPQRTAKQFGIKQAAHWRNVKLLEERGFIQSQSGKTTRQNNIYTFSSAWKNNSG